MAPPTNDGRRLVGWYRMALAAFVMVVVNTRAAEIVVVDGNLAIVLDDPATNRVVIGGAAEAETDLFTDDDAQLLTKAQVAALLTTLEATMESRWALRFAQMQERMQAQLDAKLNVTELAATVDAMLIDTANASALRTRLQGAETLAADNSQRAFAAEERLTALEQANNTLATVVESLASTKADATDVRTDDQIRAVMTAMVNNEPANNAVRNALDAKVDAVTQYADEDARDLLNDIVNNPEGDNNALRLVLDDLATRLGAAEASLGTDCGAACAAGTYEATACNVGAGTARVCSACGTGSFSYGGSVPSCTNCESCAADDYEVHGCTASSDRVCARCTTCVPGRTYETTACTTSTNRVCSSCATCASNEYIASECTVSSERVCNACTTACAANEWMAEPCKSDSNAVCQTCTVCEAGFYEARACSATADTLCLRCTDCGEDEVLTACSAAADTVCLAPNWGLNVDLATSLHQLNRAGSYVPLTGFSQNVSSLHSTFLRAGTTFDGTTVSTTDAGHYFLAYNIRIDDISDNWVHCNMGFNGANDPAVDGMSLVRGTTDYKQWTFSNAGIVQLVSGTGVGVFMAAVADNDFTVHEDSGMSAYRVHPTEGVYALLTSSYSITTSASWFKINGWTTDVATSRTRYLFGGSLQSSAYVVKESGVFLLSATVRLDGPGDTGATGSHYHRLSIVVNDSPTHNTPLHMIQGTPFPNDYMVNYVGGLAYLNAGDRVQPYGFNSYAFSFAYSPQSHLTVARLETSHAFSALMSSSMTVTTSDPVEINAWTVTPATVSICFNKGGAFDPASGRFTARRSGFYYVAANIRVDGVNTASQTLVTIKSSADNTYTDAGLTSVRTPYGTVNPAYQTLSPVGVVYLRKGDYVSVFVQVTGFSTSYIVQQESGFSAMLLDGAS
ncbi:uncharacterized protein MONBRDRAFT_5805 [Monosiga brevicollis MX1]|uniref:TNFR-Cys domain-containing protein n=1 Tax=Monosiga brevicollis TaxID=81824 RepID=A9USI5_MONBE|nr:uncharacterized protein MONBRDRAFT_5805 [Monosiga brevicollis MX1]EDQ92106.1 predicted protein [Monosiga brevicollis MX1]|eukprot:XP_001743392.1 hypothetical protein [Monosiga brevicollis MX1]